MQTTSSLYKSILSSSNHWFETKVTINDVTYTESAIKDMSISSGVFAEDTMAIGCAPAASIHLELINPSVTIPRAATIIPYYRVCNATQQSEWLKRGKFFIDTRAVEKSAGGDDILVIEGYDAMLQAEVEYSGTGFPKGAIDVLTEIATNLGWTVTNSTYTRVGSIAYYLNAPTKYTYREVLQCIAAMYGGNFIMDCDGYLRLVYLNEMPAETYYLVTESGYNLTFGQGTDEVRILLE